MFGIISVSIFVSVNEDITEANRLVHVASTHCKVQAQLLVIQYKYKYGYIIIHVFADQNRFKFFFTEFFKCDTFWQFQSISPLHCSQRMLHAAHLVAGTSSGAVRQRLAVKCVSWSYK